MPSLGKQSKRSKRVSPQRQRFASENNQFMMQQVPIIGQIQQNRTKNDRQGVAPPKQRPFD